MVLGQKEGKWGTAPYPPRCPPVKGRGEALWGGPSGAAGRLWLEEHGCAAL